MSDPLHSLVEVATAVASAQSDAKTSTAKLAVIAKRESALRDNGCSEDFLRMLKIECLSLTVKFKDDSIDETLVGLRAAVPDHWVALMKHISEVDSSLQAQLKENATDAKLWSSMLSTYAHPQLAKHIKRCQSSHGSQSNASGSEPPLAKVVEALHQLWETRANIMAPRDDDNDDDLTLPLQLQVIRELSDCELVVAPFQPFKDSNLVTRSMEVCLFLANNDAILRLSEESWTKIYSLSSTQFNEIHKYMPTKASGIDSIEIAPLVRTHLMQYGIPMRADKSVAVVVAPADLVSAFKADYTDPWKNRDRFINHLYECMDLHYANISSYKAPYTAIIQSSGTGKSKLLSEVAKQIPVIYVSLLDIKGSGFPRRTHALAPSFVWSLANKLHTVNLPALRLCGIYIAGIRCFAAHNFDPEAFFEAQDISNPTGSVGSWFTTYQVPNIDSMALTDALSLLVNETRSLEANMTRDKSAAGPNGRGMHRSPCFLLVVDEARELLNSIEKHSSNSSFDADKTTSSFRLFRNAMQELAEVVLARGSKLPLFAVLTDTSSRIGNFVPSAIEDPSSRAIPQRPKKLHNPFWLVQNSNIFFKSKVLADAHARSQHAANPISTLSAPELLDVHFKKACMYRIGRPLWQSLDYIDCTQAVAFAESKLLGVSYIDLDKTQPSLAQKMAVLNVRLPMSIHAYGTLSANLPAQHMRLVTGISEDRALVFGEYGPEPVLAAASENLMCTYPAFSPTQLLQTLREQISLGMVDAGDIGERSVVLTYLIARDRACKRRSKEQIDKEAFPLITVEALLQELHANSVSLLKGNLRVEIPNKIPKKQKNKETTAIPAAGAGAVPEAATETATTTKMLQGDIELDEATTANSVHDFEHMEVGVQADQETSSKGEDNQVAEKNETPPPPPPPPTIVYKSQSDLNDLLRGTVSFNQFIEVSYTPSVSDLLCAYLLGVGIMCRRNQAGVDLVIPVMLPARPGRSEAAFESASSLEFEGRKRLRSRVLHDDVSYNATSQRGVFDNSSSVMFADLKAGAKRKRDMLFGDIEKMGDIWNPMTSIASKLLGDLSEEERWSMTERMSAILVQVKNSPDSDSVDDANTTPERSVIRDVCGTWSDPKWRKAYVAVKHVLLSNTAKLEAMRTPSVLQHGLVLKGFNEAEQPCMENGVAGAMLQVVDTFVNHCITAGDNIDNRFISATMIDLKHKLSNRDPFMAWEDDEQAKVRFEKI